MKIATVEERKEYEDSILKAVVESATRAGCRAVYTVTCLTCNFQFLTEQMPPVCKNKKCSEYKEQP